ncbi:hypothetical protein AVEN_235428-1 [Araneus ventricosus]|uniref:RNase H type-1 domain-containing protein n=1 Tax=Araneus ventricosus TaxID=182803 RepID=A0A4Y2A4Z8_ARAVE|nr:hypothetical protein AVEN_235428-1 [Araneus ventricosus]
MWWLRPNAVKKVYLTVIEKMILYVCEAWFRNNIKIRNKVLQIKRPLLIAITKSYKTVSNEALQILSGCASLEIIEIQTTREIKKLKATNYIQNQRKIDYETKLRPWERIKIKWEYFENMTEDHHIFTDGSKIGNRFGSAYVHYAKKQEVTKSQYRLADHNTVFTAEIFAIHKAIDYILDHELYDVKIVSDSRPTLMTVDSLSDQRVLIWNMKKN